VTWNAISGGRNAIGVNGLGSGGGAESAIVEEYGRGRSIDTGGKLSFNSVLRLPSSPHSRCIRYKESTKSVSSKKLE